MSPHFAVNIAYKRVLKVQLPNWINRRTIVSCNWNVKLAVVPYKITQSVDSFHSLKNRKIDSHCGRFDIPVFTQSWQFSWFFFAIPGTVWLLLSAKRMTTSRTRWFIAKILSFKQSNSPRLSQFFIPSECIVQSRSRPLAVLYFRFGEHRNPMLNYRLSLKILKIFDNLEYKIFDNHRGKESWRR